MKESESVSRSVVFDSLRPHGLYPARLLCPWNSPGKNTGVVCHFLLQGIVPTQELNPSLLHCRQILYQLSYEGNPKQMYTAHLLHILLSVMLRIRGNQRSEWDMVLAFKIISDSNKDKHLFLFSHSVMSDSLWPHGLQHTRLLCPSLSPRVYSNSHP